MAMVGALLSSLSVCANADDIDVYNATIENQLKPNVMFVLDYSVSMLEDVNNNLIAEDQVEVTESKLDILRNAVSAVVQSNKTKINAGIASIYATHASGVLWPATDLEVDANTIDADIPIGTKDAGEIIESLLHSRQYQNSEGATSTVNALAEAAAYFRGDPVTLGDADPRVPIYFTPSKWDASNEIYTDGSSKTPIPSSYVPTDAYQYGTSTGRDSFAWCTDWDGGAQGCDGKVTFGCIDNPELNWTHTYVDDSGVTQTSSGYSPAYTQCSYEHPDRWLGANYNSPVKNCQANFIVLISDGEPTSRHNNSALSAAVDGAGNCEDLSSSIFGEAPGAKTSGNCGPEIVRKLANTDVVSDIPGSTVNTYTIGFSLEGPGKDYLKLIASAGNGGFYEATRPEELVDALNSVLDSILSGSENFSELVLDVDRASFSHDDRTYMPMFTPSGKAGWAGNLKGYYINSTGLVDTNGLPATYDDGTGIKLRADAQSFWSPYPDGNNVSDGGASGNITSGTASRNLYTFLGDESSISASGVPLTSNVDHELRSSNSLIDGPAMGLPDGSPVRDAALDWIQNAPMGDALHSKPVIVNYPNRRVVFVMTNQGFIHAIDATRPADISSGDHGGGQELYAFMPKELLSNLPELSNDTDGDGHIYGLDGGITLWHNDGNNDGIVNQADTVKLVFGMRRGGTNYYALDVTSPTVPKLAWQISGGKAPFEKLAQTWSRPSLVSVNDAGATSRVLLFSGGYDAAALDGKSIAIPSSGNAIYMVDEDGQYIWSTSETNHNKFVYSIPSDLTAIDTDRDGLADRIYVGDHSGQVWRVDFDDIRNGADFQTTLLADIGQNRQPIFYAPSISLNRSGGKKYFSIAFGTGDRTDPLNYDSTNAIYMLRDEEIEKGPPQSVVSVITEKDLYNATNNDISSSNSTTQSAARDQLNAKRGWFVNLEKAEKVLASVRTYEGTLLATSYQPSRSSATNSCEFTSTNSLYSMSIVDATPVSLIQDASDSEVARVDSKSRKTKIGSNGISASPQIVFMNDTKTPHVLVGNDLLGALEQRLHTVFWHSK